jgi:hypothetical protein
MSLVTTRCAVPLSDLRSRAPSSGPLAARAAFVASLRRNARLFSEIHAVNPRIWRLCPNVLRLPNANAYGLEQPVALPC